MTSPASKRDVRRDFEEAPPTVVAEIVGGELHLSPRPAPAHALTASVVGFELGDPFQRGRGGPGGWWILDEPELHLGGDVLVPDLAGWRRSRLPTLPDSAWFELAPDWICEVLSPATRRIDLAQKAGLYARTGVGFLWLVDPLARFVEVRRLVDARWVVEAVVEGERAARLPPFEAVELTLRDWFVPETPAAGSSEDADPG